MNGRVFFFAFILLFFAPAEAAGVKPVAALPNVPVWLSEDHSQPVIALSLSFPAGSSYDPAGKGGMAAMAGYLLNEGAGGMSADAFQAQLAAKGIELSVFPGRDFLTIRMLTLSANAKEAFRLLGLAVTKPRFDYDAVTRVRLQMMQAYDQSREDPAAVAERNFYSLYFGPYTYGRGIGGDSRSLASIAAPELHAFTKRHWVLGGLKIAVAGDISAAALAPLLKSAFAGLPDMTPPVPAAPLRAGAPGLHQIPMDVPQPVVFFGGQGLLRRDRDFMAAAVANVILGGAGSTSRLTREIREERGLTYDVATDLVPYRGAALMAGSVSTRRDAVRQMLTVLKNTMRKFAAEGPADDELAAAKQYLNGSFPLAFTSNADIAAQLNEFQCLGLPMDYSERRAGMINAVTVNDVRRVARFLYDPDKLTIVIAGSLPTRNTEPADSP